MVSLIVSGIVSLLKAVLMPLTFMWVGATRVKSKLMKKDLKDAKKGNEIETTIDRMSDDDIRKQLLDGVDDK